MSHAVVRFRLIPLPHPHPNHPDSAGESWGEIAITANAAVLLRWQWDIAAFGDWFRKNHSSLLKEELTVRREGKTFGSLERESLAEALQRLQLQDFSNGQEKLEDAWLDQLYSYRQRHSLRFGLLGADIPEIIIGINHGEGEISRFDASAHWVYEFALRASIESLEKELEQFQLQSRVRGR